MIFFEGFFFFDREEVFCCCDFFSGDADFVSLNRYLRKNGKKVILIKGGHMTTPLREESDKVINAQSIKKYIAVKKVEQAV